MPAYRTPVRYKGTRWVCVRIVDIPIRGDCAPILRVIFSHGGEGRVLLRDHRLGRLICRALFHLARRSSLALPPLLFSSPFPSFFFPRMCVLVRLAYPSRPVFSSRPVVSSRAFRCVVSSRRLVPSVVSACRLVLAPFRSAVRSFLFAYSVPVHVLGRGAGPCRHGHGAGLLSSHLFARCGMALWKDEA